MKLESSGVGLPCIMALQQRRHVMSREEVVLFETTKYISTVAYNKAIQEDRRAGGD